MAYASIIHKNWTDVTMVLRDGTGTPVTIAVDCDQADLSIENMPIGGKYQSVSHVNVRGVPHSSRYAERLDPVISFTAFLTSLGHASLESLVDFISFTGEYSGNVSSMPGVKALDLIITVEGTDHGDDADRTITITDIVFNNWGFQNGDPITLSFSGVVRGTITRA